MKNKIISIAPARTCLFGDHQDYLELPIIACAINRHIRLEAEENDTETLHLFMPDIQQQRNIPLDTPLDNIASDDHFLSAIKVLKQYGCVPNSGYDIKLTGNIPINAGTSSSSAVVVAWVQFLLEAFGASITINKEYIAQIAYEAEVVAHGAPGGRMDQFSIGLGNIIYLETGTPYTFDIIHTPLDSIIIGESGVPKKTIGVLSQLKEKALLAIHSVKEKLHDFEIKEAKREDIKKYLNYIPDTLHPYLYAAIVNHDITQKAIRAFRKKKIDLKEIGVLMDQHHEILKDTLGITIPRIDDMITAAKQAGAYGAKIVGSGGGGSIVVLAPKGKETAIIEAIKNAGAKDAYQVSVDPGARILQN